MPKTSLAVIEFCDSLKLYANKPCFLLFFNSLP